MEDVVVDLIFGIVGILFFFVLGGYLIWLRLMVHKARGNVSCPNCKVRLNPRKLEFFNIPKGKFGKHEKLSQYYVQNARKVRKLNEIKDKTRACRMQVFGCPHCMRDWVLALDFIRNGMGQFVVNIEMYPYEEVATLMESVPELPMSDTAPVTLTEKWITATYAVWAESFQFDSRYIGACESRSNENIKFMQDVLKDSWDIRSQKELLEGVKNLTEAYYEENIEEELAKHCGWDLCRACQILGMGYVAGYIDRGEMMAESLQVANIMRRYVSSWEELYKSYIIGFIMWKSRFSNDIEQDVVKRQRAADFVLAENGGPSSLDWNLVFEL